MQNKYNQILQNLTEIYRRGSTPIQISTIHQSPHFLPLSFGQEGGKSAENIILDNIWDGVNIEPNLNSCQHTKKSLIYITSNVIHGLMP